VDFVNSVVQDEHDCKLSHLFVILLFCAASRGRFDLLYPLCHLLFQISFKFKFIFGLFVACICNYSLKKCYDLDSLKLFVFYTVISAIAVINEAIDKGDHNSTLQCLHAEAAKLSGITSENSQLYQKVLYSQKIAKAQVRK